MTYRSRQGNRGRMMWWDFPSWKWHKTAVWDKFDEERPSRVLAVSLFLYVHDVRRPANFVYLLSEPIPNAHRAAGRSRKKSAFNGHEQHFCSLNFVVCLRFMLEFHEKKKPLVIISESKIQLLEIRQIPQIHAANFRAFIEDSPALSAPPIGTTLQLDT